MEKVKFTNGMLYAFHNNQAITKLLSAQINDTDTKLKLFTAVSKIEQSPQLIGLQKLLAEMADKNKNLKLENPEIQKIFMAETDFEMEKVKIQTKFLPSDFTVMDMMATKIFFDFV